LEPGFLARLFCAHLKWPVLASKMAIDAWVFGFRTQKIKHLTTLWPVLGLVSQKKSPALSRAFFVCVGGTCRNDHKDGKKRSRTGGIT
jgi:hypothetical protein